MERATAMALASSSIHRLALWLSLLVVIDLCRAFRQPPSPSRSWAGLGDFSSMTSSLRAYNINGDSPRDVRKSEGSNDPPRRLKKSRPTYSAEWQSIVDRSKTFYSSLEEEEDELCYLDDLPGKDAGETCFVSDSTSLSSDPNSSKFLASLPFNTRIPPAAIDVTLRYLPFIMPCVAYSTYESTAKFFDRIVEFISSNNWVAVDGGQYQAEIITPAINGLVVPSIAILFATLMSNTINTLRQRQLQIRTNLNTEANDLRMISTMVDSLPPELNKMKNHLREYLIQYASRVIAESRPGLSMDLQMLIGMDNEMNGFLGFWNELSISTYGTMYVDTMLPASIYSVGDASFRSHQNRLRLTSDGRRMAAPFVSPSVLSETYDALTRLRHERSARLSALQSTYPVLHYVILALLGGSICTVFLMETNQDLLLFLSAIQLRILWSMLIGTFSALAVVNYDMRDPFRGSYNVAVSVNQFYTIREAIGAKIQMEAAEEEKGNAERDKMNTEEEFVD